MLSTLSPFLIFIITAALALTKVKVANLTKGSSMISSSMVFLPYWPTNVDYSQSHGFLDVTFEAPWNFGSSYFFSILPIPEIPSSIVSSRSLSVVVDLLRTVLDISYTSKFLVATFPCICCMKINTLTLQWYPYNLSLSVSLLIIYLRFLCIRKGFLLSLSIEFLGGKTWQWRTRPTHIGVTKLCCKYERGGMGCLRKSLK